VPAPENRKIVGSKWVNNVKRDGTYKSRLVCQELVSVKRNGASARLFGDGGVAQQRTEYTKF
jgi:hypothetical protein